MIKKRADLRIGVTGWSSAVPQGFFKTIFETSSSCDSVSSARPTFEKEALSSTREMMKAAQLAKYALPVSRKGLKKVRTATAGVHLK